MELILLLFPALAAMCSWQNAEKQQRCNDQAARNQVSLARSIICTLDFRPTTRQRTELFAVSHRLLSIRYPIVDGRQQLAVPLVH
jgi:hypothetical protein